MVHWAIEALDVEAQKAFYGELFGWEIGDGAFAPIEAFTTDPEGNPAGLVQQ